ncbi:ENTH domain-containing protein 1 isoform X5 [Sesbania bispinosa]|nr:ENTH domain-containing protein 1 isoform X5 [Sesbania bispinosa]
MVQLLCQKNPIYTVQLLSFFVFIFFGFSYGAGAKQIVETLPELRLLRHERRYCRTEQRYSWTKRAAALRGRSTAAAPANDRSLELLRRRRRRRAENGD